MLTTGYNEAVMGLTELTCVGASDRYQTELLIRTRSLPQHGQESE